MRKGCAPTLRGAGVLVQSPTLQVQSVPSAQAQQDRRQPAEPIHLTPQRNPPICHARPSHLLSGLEKSGHNSIKRNTRALGMRFMHNSCPDMHNPQKKREVATCRGLPNAVSSRPPARSCPTQSIACPASISRSTANPTETSAYNNGPQQLLCNSFWQPRVHSRHPQKSPRSHSRI